MMKEKKMKHKMMAAAQEKGAAEGDLLLSIVCTSGLLRAPKAAIMTCWPQSSPTRQVL